MIMTNIESVPGKKITSLLGMVSGSTVRAKHAGKDICASFKNFFGGEIKGYTELMEESRKEATQRMVQQATKLGAKRCYQCSICHISNCSRSSGGIRIWYRSKSR